MAGPAKRPWASNSRSGAASGNRTLDLLITSNHGSHGVLIPYGVRDIGITARAELVNLAGPETISEPT